MSNELFSQQNFHEVSQSKRESLVKEIHGYDMATVLNTSMEELVEYFQEKYFMRTPIIKNMEVHLREEPKEVSKIERIPDRLWSNEYINVNRSYVQFVVFVPFEGDASLFSLRPTSYQYSSSNRMDVCIDGSNIRLNYNEPITDGSQLNLKSIYERDINMIVTNLERLAHDISLYNNSLQGLIKQKLQERKDSALKNHSIIQSIDIPIKRHDNIPKTYNIPEVRKKPNIVERKSKIETFKPEPTLALEEYENILTIVKDMSLVMERSPKTFIKLEEEEIRNHFLIQLNGHYKGNATGETFNGIGKTDIIIRHENANAFIAECKFWRGSVNSFV